MSRFTMCTHRSLHRVPLSMTLKCDVVSLLPVSYECHYILYILENLFAVFDWSDFKSQ